MLTVLKSLAGYLRDAATVDMDALPVYKPNQSQRREADASCSATSGPLNAVLDLSTETSVVVTEQGGLTWIGYTWAAPLIHVDAIRYYWPAGSGAWPVVKVQVQTSSGGAWSDETGAPGTQLSQGWNVIRLRASRDVYGVRVVRVSGGADTNLICSELEFYQDLRVIHRPGDWAGGGVWVLHSDLNLQDKVPALVTVGAVEAVQETGDTGGFTTSDRLMAFVGIHCETEDQLERHARWCELVLANAYARDVAGRLSPGIPVRAELYRLTYDGSLWWTSGQSGWLTTPAPVVRLAGAVVTPDEIDYGRGHVRLTGTTAASDVRADFTAGVWEFTFRVLARGDIEAPAQIRHRHNLFLALESGAEYRSVVDSII